MDPLGFQNGGLYLVKSKIILNLYYIINLIVEEDLLLLVIFVDYQWIED